jgi:hypothetical protein
LYSSGDKDMSKKDKVTFDDEIFEGDDFDDFEESGHKPQQSDQRKRYIREQLQLKQLAREFQLSNDDLSHI